MRLLLSAHLSMEPKSELGAVGTRKDRTLALSLQRTYLSVGCYLAIFIYYTRVNVDHLITLNLLPMRSPHMTLLDTNTVQLSRNQVSEVLWLVTEADLDWFLFFVCSFVFLWGFFEPSILIVKVRGSTDFTFQCLPSLSLPALGLPACRMHVKIKTHRG